MFLKIRKLLLHFWVFYFIGIFTYYEKYFKIKSKFHGKNNKKSYFKQQNIQVYILQNLALYKL